MDLPRLADRARRARSHAGTTGGVPSGVCEVGGAPARVSHVGEELLGPTLIAFGTEEQKHRFLPGINTVTELWAQGYSEPGAGSDLANVSTTARLDGDKWVINGRRCGRPSRTSPSGRSSSAVPNRDPSGTRA